MTTENWITIIAAVLGSGAVATVVQLIAGRFRVDRRADLIRSWKEESDIADDLYYEAIHGRKRTNNATYSSKHIKHDREEESLVATEYGEEHESGEDAEDGGIISQASRIAFSRAVRSDLNKRLSFELAPSNSVGILFGYCISAALLLGGLILTVTGIFFTASPTRDSDTSLSAGILVTIYGSLFLLLGITLFFYLDTAEKSRIRARKIILDVLNIDSPSLKQKISINNDDLVFIDGKPKLFMKNLPPRGAEEQTVDEAKPNRFRRILGEDLAFNLDSFLSQTVNSNDFVNARTFSSE